MMFQKNVLYVGKFNIILIPDPIFIVSRFIEMQSRKLIIFSPAPPILPLSDRPLTMQIGHALL